MREILRVLKPCRTFAFTADTVKDRQPNPLYRVAMPLLGPRRNDEEASGTFWKREVANEDEEGRDRIPE